MSFCYSDQVVFEKQNLNFIQSILNFIFINKTPKRLVTNEYFLGYYDANKQDPDYYKKNDDEMIPNVGNPNL
jgi:hypothetical protein